MRAVELAAHNLVVGEPAGALAKHLVGGVDGLARSVAHQHPVLRSDGVQILPADGGVGAHTVRNVGERTRKRVHHVVVVEQVALHKRRLARTYGVLPRLAARRVVLVALAVRQRINDAQAVGAEFLAASAAVLKREGRQKHLILQPPVVLELLGDPNALRRGEQKHLVRGRHALRKRAGAVVEAQPVGGTALVVETVLERGNRIVAARKTHLLKSLSGKALGVHLDHAAGKLTGKLRRGRLDDHEVVEQGRGKHVKRKRLAVRFGRRQRGAVQVGRVVAVVESAHNGELIVLNGRARNALEHVARVAVRSAANGF